MTSRSIFQKVCPSCMLAVSIDTDMCSCGYHFDLDNTDSSLSSEEIRLQAEELYESYLAARVEQAESAIQAAQAEFKRDPTNEKKSNRVTWAIQEAQAAKTALAMQSSQIAEMKQALPSLKLPLNLDATPRRDNKRPATAMNPVVPQPVQQPLKRNTSAAEKPRTPINGKQLTHQPLVQSKPKPPTAPISKANGHATLPAQTTVPSPVFRQAQAAKAEKIFRRAKTAEAAPTNAKNKTLDANVAPKATVEVFSATKKAPRLYVLENKKECPNCTATVESRLTRCRCGYEFSSSEQLIPPLSLSEEDRAAFSKLFR